VQEYVLMYALLWACAVAVVYSAVWYASKRRARQAEREYPPTGQFVSVDGVNLHYVQRDAGPAVVLLHGSDGFLQDFTLTVMDRIAVSFTAIAVDRPGHGYSDAPASPRPTLTTQARLIHRALRKLGVERPILVGHSWSALLLLYYAWKYPADVSGLVMAAPSIYPDRAHETLLRLVSNPWISRLLHPLFTIVKGPIIRRFLAQAFAPAVAPPEYSRQAEALWLRTAAQMATTARENRSERSALDSFAPAHVSSTIPILIVVGDRDRVTPVDRQAGRLLAEMPQAALITVGNTGHQLLHTAPESLVHAIERCWELIRRNSGPPIESHPQPVPVSIPEVSRARNLVMRYGWNSTAYQILNPDIERWFSDDGDACIGFVTWGSVRVVAGAPVCAENRLAEIAQAFEYEARESGESVCYFGAANRLREALLCMPAHSSVVIGAQPAWRPKNWAHILKRHRSLRAQLNRARNKGVTVEEWSSERAMADARLGRCFDEWHESHSGFELHFLTEPVPLDRLHDRRTLVAELNGEPIGFLIATPVPDRNGWLVEQIVRGHAAPNGTAEMLIDALMRAAATDGCEYVTLGLAPLSRRSGEAPNRRLWLRILLGWMRAHGRRFYNFEGLDSFKAKFQPDFWEPIYAISNESRFSLRTLYGIAAAFTEGAPLSALARAAISAMKQEWHWARGGRFGAH